MKSIFTILVCFLCLAEASFGEEEKWPLTAGEVDEIFARGRPGGVPSGPDHIAKRKYLMKLFHLQASRAASPAFFRVFPGNWDPRLSKDQKEKIIDEAKQAAAKAARQEIQRWKDMVAPGGKKLTPSRLLLQMYPLDMANVEYLDLNRFLDDDGNVNLRGLEIGAERGPEAKRKPVDLMAVLDARYPGSPQERWEANLKVAQRAAADGEKHKAEYEFMERHAAETPAREYEGYRRRSHSESCPPGGCGQGSGALRPESNGRR